YGSLNLDTESGEWTYTLNETAADSLNQGQTAAETFTYTVNDEHGATATSTLTITITGANDNPTANADEGGAVTESGGLANGTACVATATGTLANNVSDIDNGGSLTDALSLHEAIPISYGSLTLDTESGEWTYTLNETAADSLNQGQTAVETFTYT